MNPQVRTLLEFRNLLLHPLGEDERGYDREIQSANLNRPGLEISGCLDYFEEDRIQILGKGEIHYLERHGNLENIQAALKALFESRIPCIIIANNLEAPECLRRLSRQYSLPLFKTPLTTTRLYKRLFESLEQYFCPSTTINGTLVDVLGMGVLLLGESGVGKSECALELVSRGHSLVADDVVRVICLGERSLRGSSPRLLRHFLEVRGLGIVDISRMYGVRAVRREKQIDMVITLIEWNQDLVVDRIGDSDDTYEILGVFLPHKVIPIRPGRNLSTIVEVGARDQRLKLMGVNMAQDFILQQRKATNPRRIKTEEEEPLLGI